MKTKKANILTERANGNPFRVPEGYFNLLPQQIMDQLGTVQEPKQQKFIIRFLKPALAIAAGFAIMVILTLFPLKNFRTDNPINYQSVSFDEEYYISCSMDDDKIYETLISEAPEASVDYKQLENILLGSVSEYDLIVLNN